MTHAIPNYGGRFQYLDAAEVHWPELLRALRNQVLDSFSAYAKVRGAPAPTTHAELCEGASGGGSNEQACHRFDTWAESLGIVDAWLRDAAVQTLAMWSQDKDQNCWYYTPKDLNTPTFDPSFKTMWLPRVMSWREFRKQTDNHYQQELKKYRETVALLWGTGGNTLGPDIVAEWSRTDDKRLDPGMVAELWGIGEKALWQPAIWTVLWQRGKSPGYIRLREHRRTGRQPTLQNIQARVHEFAESIGITLREQKRGRRRNTTRGRES